MSGPRLVEGLKVELECANCGSLEMDHGDTWYGLPVCYECNQRGFHLANEQRDRVEKAEAERDEARRLAVRAVYVQGALGAQSGEPAWGADDPHGRVLGHEGWDKGVALRFHSQAESLAAGRAVPGWVKANGVGA